MRSSLPPAALAAVLVAGCVFDRTGVTSGSNLDSSVDQETDAPLEDSREEDLPDAGPEPDQGTCPKECDSCEDGVCRILGDKGCKNGCTCPAGVDCEVICGYPFHCQGAIDCSKASSCDIQCNPAGGRACTGDITCGSGDCTVVCGYDACEGAIDCSQAASCDIDCSAPKGEDACHGAITCGAGPCDVSCGKLSCKSDIDCSSSCGCAVDCSGIDACDGISISCPSACAGGCDAEDGCDNC